MSNERNGHGHHHGSNFPGMCRCNCHGGRFVGKKERTEMLEEHLVSLKRETVEVEEELKELKK